MKRQSTRTEEALRCALLVGALIVGATSAVSRAQAAEATPPIFRTLQDCRSGKTTTPDYSRAGKNLLANAGFEELGPGGAPTHWRAAGKVSLATEPAHSGKRAPSVG